MNPLILSILVRSMMLPGGALEGTERFFFNLSNAVNGVITDSQGIATINQVGQINPIINVNRSTGVAPLSITFDASETQIANNISTLPFHDIHYVWDFGDDVGATWSTGIRANTGNKNTSQGPVAAHIFETSGTRIVTLWCYYLKSDNTLVVGNKTVTITIQSADDVFTSNTVYVSSSGLPVAGVDGVPVGANCQQVTTWTSIGTLSSTYKRILLKRGDTWNTNGVASLTTGAGLIGAYGTGNKPKIVISTTASAFNIYTAVDWRIVDLEITSDLSESNTKIAVATDSANTLVLRCHIHNVQSGVQSSPFTNGVYIVDTIIEDMFTAPIEGGSHGGPCAFFDTTDRIAIMGCTIRRAFASHLTRLQGTSYSVVSDNTYTTMTGFNYNSITLRGKTTDNGNPQIWNSLWSQCNVIRNNVVDGILGGGYTVHSGPQSTGHAERVRDLIVENNYVISGGLTPMNFSVTNLSCRNNIIDTTYNEAIGIGSGNVTGVPSPSNNFFYANSIVKRNVSVNAWFSAFTMNGGGQSNIVIKNNIAYAPNTTKNSLQSANNPEFITAYGGSDFNNYTLLSNTSDAQIAATNPFLVAMPSQLSEFTPTGYAIGTGSYTPLRVDFNGNTISALTRDKGAIQ